MAERTPAPKMTMIARVQRDLMRHRRGTHIEIAARLRATPQQVSGALHGLLDRGAVRKARNETWVFVRAVPMRAARVATKGPSAIHDAAPLDQDAQMRFVLAYMERGEPLLQAEDIAREFGCSLAGGERIREWLAQELFQGRRVAMGLEDIGILLGRSHQGMKQAETKALDHALASIRKLGIEEDLRDELAGPPETFAEIAERNAPGQIAYAAWNNANSFTALAQRSGRHYDPRAERSIARRAG